MTEAAPRNDFRRAWLDEDESGLSAARVAKHRLVEQVRRLVDAAFQLDAGDVGYGPRADGAPSWPDEGAGAASDTDRAAQFMALAADAEALADRIGALPRVPRAPQVAMARDVSDDAGAANANACDNDSNTAAKVAGPTAANTAAEANTEADSETAAEVADPAAANAASAASAADSLAKVAGPDPSPGPSASLARRHDMLLVERSTINGRGNPLAPPVRMWADGELIRGEAYFTAPYEGPPGRVHGAWVAACFDEVLGCAQGASGAFGYTGTLTITLRRATPLYTRITYEAGFSRREGRKIHAWGRCYADGRLTAQATAVFVVPAAGHIGHGATA